MSIKPPSERESGSRYEEEVRLVAGILERADRTVRPSAVLLLTWGVLGLVVDLGFYLYYRSFYTGGHPSEMLRQLALPSLAIGLAVTVARGLLMRPARRTAVDRAVAVTFSVAAICALVPNFLGFPQWVMAGPAHGIFWNLMAASAAGSIGVQYREVPLIAGALALGGAVVVASFDVYQIDLILALGMFLGLAGPGVYYAVRGARR
jgi:hypothetical protein